MMVVAKRNALDIVQDEHRAIAAVVHCLEQILAEIRTESIAPPFEALELILRYLSDFSDRFHHPKEDDFLFPALVKRDPGSRDIIRELERQHERGQDLTLDLATKLEEFRADPVGGFEAFDKQAGQFIAFQKEHIRLEEQMIVPAARDKLRSEDWATIDAAFNENEDPIFGANPQAEFDGLFRKIVSAAPAPWGLGPRKEGKRSKVLTGVRFGRK